MHFTHLPLLLQRLDLTSVSKFLQQPSQPQTAVPATANGNSQDARVLPPAELHLGWPLGQTLDMHVYLSTSPNGDVFTQWTNGWRKNQDDGLPHVVWEKITFGDYADHRVVDFEVKFLEVTCISFHAVCNN